jgi:hypothetical protein
MLPHDHRASAQPPAYLPPLLPPVGRLCVCEFEFSTVPSCIRFRADAPDPAIALLSMVRSDTKPSPELAPFVETPVFSLDRS